MTSCNSINAEEHLFEDATIHYGLTVQGDQYLKSDIDEAIDFWNKSFGDGFLISNAGKFPAYIQIREDQIVPYADGATYRYTDHCLINLKPKNDGYNYSRIIIHEVGHCLGLDHSNNIQSIMFPYLLGDQIITDQIIEIISQGH